MCALRSDTSSTPGRAQLLTRIASLEQAARQHAQTVRALREREEHLRQVLERAADGIIINTLDDRIVEVNPHFCELMGYSRDEMLQLTVADLQAPEVRGKPGSIVRKEIEEHDGKPFETVNIRKDGRRIPLELSTALIESSDGPFALSIIRDISQRVKTQTELRESEEKFRQLVEHINGVFWVRSYPDGELLHVSPGYERIWGRPLTTFKKNGFAFIDAIHPDDRNKVRRAAEAMIKVPSTPFACIEYRVVRPDGSVRWIRDQGFAITDGDGRHFCNAGLALDITETKRVSDLLAAERSVLEMVATGRPLQEVLDAITRNIEEVAPGTICSILLLDAERRQLQHGSAPSLPDEYNRAVHGLEIGPKVGSCGAAAYANKRIITEDIHKDPKWTPEFRTLADKFGLRSCWSTPIRARDGSAQGTFAMYHRLPRKPTRRELQEAEAAAHLATVAIEHHRNEQTLRRLNSELEARVQSRTTALNAANERLTEEIRERRQAATALAESEDFLRSTLNALSAEIAILDNRGNITAINESWRRRSEASHLGLPRRGIGANYLAVCDGAIGPEAPTARRAAAAIRAVLAGRSDAESLEYACPSDDEKDRWFILRVTKFQRNGDHHAVVAHEDISQQRRAEERARRVSADLAHVQRISMMGEMTSGLAHEINQPLSAIATFAEAARLSIHPSDAKTKRVADLLGDVIRESHRAGEITRRLRNFVRKRAVCTSSVDLNEAITEVVALVEQEARDHEIGVSCILAADLPLLQADSVQIQQVVLNLVRNAIEAIADDNRDNRQVVLETRRLPDAVEVNVTDHGRGLDDDDLARLFEPFFTTKESGLGLGLAISKTIIEAHRGRLTAEQRDGGGMIFRFRLPTCERETRDE